VKDKPALASGVEWVGWLIFVCWAIGLLGWAVATWFVCST